MFWLKSAFPLCCSFLMFRPVKHIQINSWIWALEQLDTRDNHVTLVRRCVVLWILPDQWIVGWKYLLSLLCLLKVMRKAALNHVSLSFLSWFNYNLWLSYCVSPSTPLCFFSFPVVGVDYAVSHTAVHFTAERRDSFSVLQRTRLDGSQAQQHRFMTMTMLTLNK